MSEAAANKITALPGADAGAIYRRMPEIMKEVGAVGKARRNTQQGYDFRGIDDVYEALQLVMAKHGVFVMPEALSETWEERQSKSGGVLMWLRSKIKHTFYASDGSSVVAVTYGEGMDSGDKASNKAMSVAMKYALIEAFCIPTRDAKDPENESPEPQPKPTTGRAPAQQAQKKSAFRPTGDSGEIIDGKRAERVRTLLLDELKLERKRAVEYLEEWFGVSSPFDMTDGMGKTAETLCLALKEGPGTYQENLAAKRKAGLVRTGKEAA